MAGVNKEIWTDVLLEGFIPDGAFLGRSRDLSEFVDYNTLHFAEAGADPKVLVDNLSFPVATSQRTDTPKEITLKTFDTENTVVRNIEEIESSYKKMESVIRSHRNALYKKCVGFAAHAWAFTHRTAFLGALFPLLLLSCGWLIYRIRAIRRAAQDEDLEELPEESEDKEV